MDKSFAEVDPLIGIEKKKTIEFSRNFAANRNAIKLKRNTQSKSASIAVQFDIVLIDIMFSCCTRPSQIFIDLFELIYSHWIL